MGKAKAVFLGMFFSACGTSGIYCSAPLEAAPSSAENFHVENRVFVDDEQTPSIQSVTVFHNDMVYDSIKSPPETVVFDRANKRFILLNLKRRTRAELTAAEVLAFCDKLQETAARSNDPLIRFLAEPQFEEKEDAGTGRLELISPTVSYSVSLLAEENRSVVEQYHEFADWYARLNALLVAGSRPPFGRLVVNAAVAKRQSLPGEVLLTLRTAKNDRPAETKIRSEHRFARPLAVADVDLVRQSREQMADFKRVSFSQYRKDEPR